MVMFKVACIDSTPFDGQNPGTFGLRKKHDVLGQKSSVSSSLAKQQASSCMKNLGKITAVPSHSTKKWLTLANVTSQRHETQSGPRSLDSGSSIMVGNLQIAWKSLKCRCSNPKPFNNKNDSRG
ncbi:uncharacterized protein LOC130755177 [Actinidia eriantha]|uniref:uncharacterized protein LOC130755177 n=1 Tax=Actinidia eriantha TaxID=165200 RepID=UPI002589E924|nr:uncharacterized protein LOC130755177 [Actinidia eriantha]